MRTAPDVARLRDLWLEAQSMRGYSPRSVVSWRLEATRFAAWCEARGIYRAREVTKPIMEQYRRHMFYFRRAPGPRAEPGSHRMVDGALSIRTQHARLAYLRSWFW